MQITPYDGRGGQQTIQTKLLSIQERIFKNNVSNSEFMVVFVYTTDGTFSTSRQKFDDMHVDIQHLQKNDDVEVSFYKNAKGFNVLTMLAPVCPF